MFNGNKFFNNIQGKVKKMEGASESRKENQTKGEKKRFYINVHRKYLGIKIRIFFGTDLKKNIMGEESIVWKYLVHIYYRLLVNVKLVV